MQIGKAIVLTGDPSLFAIECCITRAQADWGHLALGFFCLWINGVCYGVREPEATMLGCSYNEVADRITRRGQHTTPFGKDPTAIELADAFLQAIYS
ncbi:MAG TPA: Imm42 family immunity protein, partial [Candidatus Limnocylindria bacterium]|nr:Imm42 family immunity protein [Candidatus Limnocylindria bacterium]